MSPPMSLADELPAAGARTDRLPVLDPWRRERLLAFSGVVALTLFRAALFVFKTQLDFDSDQAVVGLAGKHLMEGRAFPLFFYGQNYWLAIESWLAAPMFWLFGVSVAALKLPLFLINIAIGILLTWLFERELGVRPALGLVAASFFVLAPPGTAALLVQARGNVEPLLYVLVLWLTRSRPVWFGLVFGLGFLQREFTIFGVLAVLVIEIANGAWRDRDAWRRLWSAVRVAVEVWLVVQVLRPFASAAGPGTTVADLVNAPSNNLIEVARRFCFDPRTILTGVHGLVTVHWAQLFGTAVAPGYNFGLESNAVEGLWGLGFVLGTAALVAVYRIVLLARHQSGWWTRYRFSIYLAMVGAFSAGAFTLGRCGTVSHLRYDLLSLLGAAGLAAWFFAAERSRWIRQAGVAVVLLWAAVSAVAHGRMWYEYEGSRAPVAAKTSIIRHLEARGIKYALSDYWMAYYITFATNERVIVAPDAFARIATYGDTVLKHRDQAVHISRAPCGTERPVIEGVYFCPFD
jgi:hypothetical protein